MAMVHVGDFDVGRRGENVCGVASTRTAARCSDGAHVFVYPGKRCFTHIHK